MIHLAAKLAAVREADLRAKLAEARREISGFRRVLADALGPLPTDHTILIGEARVRLAEAVRLRDVAAGLQREVDDLQARESIAWQSHLDTLARARAEADRLLLAECEKTKAYRDRCPVTAEDVDAAGVTYAHLDAFAAAHGFTPARWDTRGLKHRLGQGWRVHRRLRRVAWRPSLPRPDRRRSGGLRGHGLD